MSETTVTPPYERTETFVFRFTDKKVFEAFFDEYFKGEGRHPSITVPSCQHEDAIKEKEDVETFVCEFMEEFKLIDMAQFKADTPKKEELLAKMEKFLEGCPY